MTIMLQTKESLLIAYVYLLLKVDELSSPDDQGGVLVGPDSVATAIMLRSGGAGSNTQGRIMVGIYSQQGNLDDAWTSWWGWDTKAEELFTELTHQLKVLKRENKVHGNIKPEKISIRSLSKKTTFVLEAPSSGYVHVSGKNNAGQCWEPRKVSLEKFCTSFAEYSKLSPDDAQLIQSQLKQHQHNWRNSNEEEDVLMILNYVLKPTRKETDCDTKLFTANGKYAEAFRCAAKKQGLAGLELAQRDRITGATYEFLTPKRRKTSGGWYDGSREDYLVVLSLVTLLRLGRPQTDFRKVSEFLEDSFLKRLDGRKQNDLSKVTYADLCRIGYVPRLDLFGMYTESEGITKPRRVAANIQFIKHDSRV